MKTCNQLIQKNEGPLLEAVAKQQGGDPGRAGTSLQDALEFIHGTDAAIWNRLIDEMNFTRKRRDVEAAKNFKLGDLVVFEPPDPKDFRKGRIIHISRAGRVTLAVPSEESGFLERIGVPAIYLRSVA